MASYPNSPWYPGQRTPGVVVEFTSGDPSTSSALAGIPVSAANPFPVTIISGGGGGGGAFNLTQVGGSSIAIGADPSPVGAASLPVVFPQGYALSITGSVTASLGALVAGNAIIGQVGIDQTTDGTTNAVHLKAGTALAGKFGIDQVTANANNVQIAPLAGTGWIVDSYIIANNTTAVVVKSGACLVGKLELLNNSVTPAYLKLYNATSATAGSGTPKYRGVFFAPAAGGGGMVSSETVGAIFSTGATFIVTTGLADNDTGTPAAATYILNVWHT